MTLERRPTGSGTVRVKLVRCPFCETDLRGRSRVHHLENCERFKNWSPDDATA